MREMELAKAGGGDPTIVAVGKKLRDFIQQNPEVYREIMGEHAVHAITHFAPTAIPHFSRFAQDRKAEFSRFSETVGKDYERWLLDPQGGGREFPWQREIFERNPDLDLRRLFMWSHEMRAIRLLAEQQPRPLTSS